MINHFAQLTKLNAHTSMLEAARPLQVDLIWLTKQLDELEAIRQMADAAHRQFQHGVIYAIKVRPEYWKSLREISFMGIEATMPIPASTIISKIVIPASYVWKVGRHNNVVEKSSLRKQMLNALENKLKSEIRAI